MNIQPDLLNPITIHDLEEITGAAGEGWALPHVHRLLRLVDVIGAGLSHDPAALAIAIYLHDWGSSPAYAQKDVPHARKKLCYNSQ